MSSRKEKRWRQFRRREDEARADNHWQEMHLPDTQVGAEGEAAAGQRHLDDPTRSRRSGAPSSAPSHDPRLPAAENREHWQRGAGREDWTRAGQPPDSARDEPGREDWGRGYRRAEWPQTHSGERPRSEREAWERAARGEWPAQDEPPRQPAHGAWELGQWTAAGREEYPEYAIQREPASYAGKGPKGYSRPDERIREELSERLMVDERVDASNIDVEVRVGTVTLRGVVRDRRMKHLIDAIAEDVTGVTDVQNELRVARDDEIRDAARETLGRFPDERTTFGVNRR